MQIVVRDSIERPVQEVFRTIVDPDGLNKFFTTDSSGPLVEGSEIAWVFGTQGDAKLDVKVLRITNDRLISWEWAARGALSQVTIELAPSVSGGTDFTVTEKDFPLDLDGVAGAVGQTQGWTYFVTTLRAWLVDGTQHAGLNDGISATAIDGD